MRHSRSSADDLRFVVHSGEALSFARAHHEGEADDDVHAEGDPGEVVGEAEVPAATLGQPGREVALLVVGRVVLHLHHHHHHAGADEVHSPGEPLEHVSVFLEGVHREPDAHEQHDQAERAEGHLGAGVLENCAVDFHVLPDSFFRREDTEEGTGALFGSGLAIGHSRRSGSAHPEETHVGVEEEALGAVHVHGTGLGRRNGYPLFGANADDPQEEAQHGGQGGPQEGASLALQNSLGILFGSGSGLLEATLASFPAAAALAGPRLLRGTHDSRKTGLRQVTKAPDGNSAEEIREAVHK